MNHYLLAAYGIMWLILFGYVFSIGRRQLRLQQELARLREALEKAEAKTDPYWRDWSAIGHEPFRPVRRSRVQERGARGQSLDRRLFLQLQAFGNCTRSTNRSFEPSKQSAPTIWSSIRT